MSKPQFDGTEDFNEVYAARPHELLSADSGWLDCVEAEKIRQAATIIETLYADRARVIREVEALILPKEEMQHHAWFNAAISQVLAILSDKEAGDAR